MGTHWTWTPALLQTPSNKNLSQKIKRLSWTWVRTWNLESPRLAEHGTSELARFIWIKLPPCWETHQHALTVTNHLRSALPCCPESCCVTLAWLSSTFCYCPSHNLSLSCVPHVPWKLHWLKDPGGHWMPSRMTHGSFHMVVLTARMDNGNYKTNQRCLGLTLVIITIVVNKIKQVANGT